MLLAYVGPDVVLPVASVLAAVAGGFLIAGRATGRVLARVARRVVRRRPARVRA